MAPALACSTYPQAGPTKTRLRSTEVLDATSQAEPDDVTVEDVRMHGAGKGSRWPALLLLLVILAVAAFVLWWSLVR